MGSMQFILPEQAGIPKYALDGAYMIGSDGAPWETRVEWTGSRLVVSRDTRESGYLVVPWPLADFGAMALSTATLLPRDTPYHLALELARGTLSRLLHVTDGATSPGLLTQPLSEARHHFIQASLSQNDPQRCAEEAQRSLGWSMDCIRKFVRQATAARNSQASFSSRLFGFQVSGPDELTALRSLRRTPGNAILFGCPWRETEASPGEWDWTHWKAGLKAAHAARRRVLAGPLVNLERSELPDWLYLWDDDFDTLQSYVEQYIRQLVIMARGQVHVWYVTSGTNVDRALRLGEEHRLRLTLAALEALRSEDKQTPTLVGIQQPWGEYLGRSTLDLSPPQFADILLRADLGVSGFALELDFADDVQHSLTRDLLEFQGLLDQWSSFGVPLVLRINLPTESGDQEAARLDYLRDLLAVAAPKPAIQGVIWGQLKDRPQRRAGVLTADGQPKGVLQTLSQMDQRSRRGG